MAYMLFLTIPHKNFFLLTTKVNRRTSQKVLAPVESGLNFADPLEFLPTAPTSTLELVNPVTWKTVDTYSTLLFLH